MLYDERGLDTEAATFFDSEGFVLELVDGALTGEIDGDVFAALDFEREGFDDAFAGIVGVGYRGARSQA